jgi:hypothetical protein
VASFASKESGMTRADAVLAAMEALLELASRRFGFEARLWGMEFISRANRDATT